MHDDGEPRWEFRAAAPGVTVCRPRTPSNAHGGFGDEQYPHLRRWCGTSSSTAPPAEYDLWFYTPMALPLADSWRRAS